MRHQPRANRTPQSGTGIKPGALAPGHQFRKFRIAAKQRRNLARSATAGSSSSANVHCDSANGQLKIRPAPADLALQKLSPLSPQFFSLDSGSAVNPSSGRNEHCWTSQQWHPKSVLCRATPP